MKLIALAVLVVLVPVIVLAQATAADPAALLTVLLSAAQGKHWSVVIGVVLSLVTYASRTWLLPNWKWAKTDRGGAFLAIGIAAVGTVGASLATGTTSPWTVLDALASAFLSTGAYATYHKIRNPADAPPKV